MSKTRMLAVALVWITIIGLAAMFYRWVFVPKQQKSAQLAQEQQKKDTLNNTSSDTRYKCQLNLALDSFSGYAILRSESFRNECGSCGIKLNLIDDKADYNSRLKALQNGEVQLAAFTIDALIKASATLGDLPATIVAVVDETKGADAMVGSKLMPNIDALNSPDTKFVVTPDSPSETLSRVVMAYFKLDKLGHDPWIKVDGAKAVFDEYRASKPTDKKVFVLWEPYVSKITTDNPEYRIIIDSSKFKGYIVDVLVVNRDFLVKNETIVKDVVESYFRANFTNRLRMTELVTEDSGDILKPQQAKKLAYTILWKNTQENYAHFGLLPGYQPLEDMILNITAVLKNTGAITSDPTAGKPNMLYFDKIIRTMFENNFHPGSEEVRPDIAPISLSEDEWGQLRPIGTLQVSRLVFARGTARLTEASEETLVDLAKKLQTWPRYYLVVRGNCSKEGDPEANRNLAKQRAQAATDWLVKNGVNQARVRADTSEPNGSTTVAFILGQLPY